jgi:NAD(P)H dehydrogenase (quinone)
MPKPKASILVVFYSRDGSVEALAKSVSEGAREAGAEVRLRRVPDIVSSGGDGQISRLGGAQQEDARRVWSPNVSRRGVESYSAPQHVLVILLLNSKHS